MASTTFGAVRYTVMKSQLTKMVRQIHTEQTFRKQTYIINADCNDYCSDRILWISSRSYVVYRQVFQISLRRRQRQHKMRGESTRQRWNQGPLKR